MFSKFENQEENKLSLLKPKFDLFTTALRRPKVMGSNYPSGMSPPMGAYCKKVNGN